MLMHGFIIMLLIYYGIDMTDVMHWDYSKLSDIYDVDYEDGTVSGSEPPKVNEKNIIATKFIPNTSELECAQHCYHSQRCHYCSVQHRSRECQLIQVEFL